MMLTKCHSLRLVLCTLVCTVYLVSGNPVFAQLGKPDPRIHVSILQRPKQICLGESVKVRFLVRNLGMSSVFLTPVPPRYATQSETREISIMLEMFVNYHDFELPKFTELKPREQRTKTISVDSERFGFGKNKITGPWTFDLSVGYLSQDGMDLIRELSGYQTNVGRQFTEQQKAIVSDKVSIQINSGSCR